MRRYFFEVKTYETSSEPVIEYYKQSNLVKEINGEGSITEISAEEVV